jgi:6-phosphogluconolactonase
MESELTAKVYVFALDAKTGKVSEVQQVSGVPAGFSGETSGAEIAVSRDGRFVYTSNRGDDTLEAYARKQSSGKLTEIQRLPAQGKNPWSFAIDPSAHWLLVTDQASNEVVVLKINPRTGKLSASGMSMPCLSPVSATFWVQ